MAASRLKKFEWLFSCLFLLISKLGEWELLTLSLEKEAECLFFIYIMIQILPPIGGAASIKNILIHCTYLNSALEWRYFRLIPSSHCVILTMPATQLGKRWCTEFGNVVLVVLLWIHCCGFPLMKSVVMR